MEHFFVRFRQDSFWGIIDYGNVFFLELHAIAADGLIKKLTHIDWFRIDLEFAELALDPLKCSIKIFKDAVNVVTDRAIESVFIRLSKFRITLKQSHHVKGRDKRRTEVVRQDRDQV
ncbi:hypothetical protein D9M72_587130 [compost metagenome]